MKTATKRPRTRAVPRPAPSPLPTLADYGLKPREQLPGESWEDCCDQEWWYTQGFRAGLAGREHPGLTRWEHLGHADGARVRERRASK